MIFYSIEMYGECALTYASFLDKLITQACDKDLRLREQSLMVRSKPLLLRWNIRSGYPGINMGSGHHQ